jgi:putative transposase
MYHVTSRGVARRAIFQTDNDRRAFLSTIRDVVVERSWRCHAYCLMGNHYHLLVDTPSADLPEGMRDLNSAYATRFNTAHECKGHVFQGRYAARLVRSHEHAVEVARYIPLNPVRAGICAVPEHWAWSSYRAIAGLAPTPTFLDPTATLDWFGGGRPAAVRYREFVARGRGVTDPEAAALVAILSSGRLEDAHLAHDQYGYSLRTIASHMGIPHSKLARRLQAMSAPKGV